MRSVPIFLHARSRDFLTFTDSKKFRLQRFIETLAPHSLKQSACIGNQRHAAQFPILCARLGITAHDDLASVKIHVSPSDLSRLTNTATSKRQVPPLSLRSSSNRDCGQHASPSINALNLSMVGNAISLRRTGARFAAVAALL